MLWTGDTAENIPPKREDRRAGLSWMDWCLAHSAPAFIWVVTSVTTAIPSGPWNPCGICFMGLFRELNDVKTTKHLAQAWHMVTAQLMLATFNHFSRLLRVTDWASGKVVREKRTGVDRSEPTPKWKNNPKTSRDLVVSPFSMGHPCLLSAILTQLWGAG